MDVFPCCEQLHALCPVPLDFCNRVVDTKKAAHRKGGAQKRWRTESRHQKLPAIYFHPSARGSAFRGTGARMRAVQPQPVAEIQGGGRLRHTGVHPPR